MSRFTSSCPRPALLRPRHDVRPSSSAIRFAVPRASILRGQYAHNTHIVGNEQPWGGFEKFRHLGLEESTVATWLQDAGYHTAMIGKYLNRYVPERDGVPPGWDEWYVGGNAHPSYDYTLNENGRVATTATSPRTT